MKEGGRSTGIPRQRGRLLHFYMPCPFPPSICPLQVTRETEQEPPTTRNPFQSLQASASMRMLSLSLSHLPRPAMLHRRD